MLRIEEQVAGAVRAGKRTQTDLKRLRLQRFKQEQTLHAAESALTVALAQLRAALGCKGPEPRFEVVYHLHSTARNQRLRVKCRLGAADPEIDSVTGVWRGANWYEREVFDMFGIKFRNHPNLTRILMPVDWEGHPLRKDYPVHGYKYSYPTDK